MGLLDFTLLSVPNGYGYSDGLSSCNGGVWSYCAFMKEVGGGSRRNEGFSH